jgi:hypothetical protein
LVRVVGKNEHAGLDEPHLHRKDVAESAAPDIEELRDAVLAHDLAHVLLPLCGRGIGRDRLMIGRDQDALGIEQLRDALLLQRLVEVHDVPVVTGHQVRLRIDDLAGLDRPLHHARQDLFCYGLSHVILRRDRAFVAQ